MPRRVPPDAVATARHLLAEYYASGKRRHTFDSIARRAGVSRSTVARTAREVREVWPTITQLTDRIEQLEARLAALEIQLNKKEMNRWAS
jgi:methylphosphotriester-DNA--protein-cysteine methyltransferase